MIVNIVHFIHNPDLMGFAAILLSPQSIHNQSATNPQNPKNSQ